MQTSMDLMLESVERVAKPHAPITPKHETVFSVCRVSLVREQESDYSVVLTQPRDAVEAIRKATHIDEEPVEVLYLLALNMKNRLIGLHQLFRGMVNTSPVSTREIFQAAFLHNAASIIIMHNHPSGDPNPSPEDVAVSKRVLDAGKLMDCPLLDSIIVGENGRLVSLKERGLL